MRDFLIDTNIWAYWFNENKEPQHSKVLKRVRELEEMDAKNPAPFHIWTSSVTWGEIEYGYRVQRKDKRSLEKPFRRFVGSIAPKEYPVDRDVTQDYGKIRARLFKKYGPNGKKRKGLRPEQLFDPVTSLQLQIQENDLWIAAQAITRDLTLVTADRKSLRPLLDVVGDELHVENWAEGA